MKPGQAGRPIDKYKLEIRRKSSDFFFGNQGLNKPGSIAIFSFSGLR
jgi:hypothetical protein